MQYQINPIVVDAVKVAGVGDRLSDGSIRVLLEGEGPKANGTVIKRHEMMATPKVGDYFVTNEDGGRVLIPRAAFEATHTAVEAEQAPLSVEEVDVAPFADDEVAHELAAENSELLD